MDKETVKKLRQIIPVIIGSLLGVSCGTMLGWTSATFPELLDLDNSPIPITLNESATICAFLMEGIIVGTVFSSITFLGSKVGVLLSGVCQIAGWLVMFFAEDILGIAISRILIGFGNGFGTGQLRIYTKESCEPKLFQLLMKYMPVNINVGLIFIYIIGGFVSFRTLSLVCMAIPIVNVVLFAIIPKHIYKFPSLHYSEPIPTICEIKPSIGINGTDTEIKVIKKPNNSQIGVIEALKTKKVRNSLFLLFFVIFIPQYTGGAANINYSQIVHIAAANPNPHLCSIIYSFVYLFATIAAIKYTNKFSRKPVLVGSCLLCSLLLCLTCLNYYYLPDLLEISSIFTWGPLLLLSLYNTVHTMGIYTITLLLITDKFPENARIIGSKFHLMYFSLSAIFSTKIFQALFTIYGMHMPYVFLSAFSLGSAILALFFFKETKRSQTSLNTEGIYNNTVDLRDETPSMRNKYNNY